MESINKLVTRAALPLALAAALTASANAAVRSGFNTNTFAGNDDDSISNVNVGFTMDFFGLVQNYVHINNNGNVTFDSVLSTYTPFDLLSTSTQIIAPFFADVDTSNSAEVTYGSGTVDGHTAFGVNWIDVGYYDAQSDPTNSFQLVLIDRSDIAAGDFDFEFNYDNIEWETGDASEGSNGLGGYSARVGFSNGTDTSLELLGSAVNGAFLNGGSNALISNSLNSNVAGRYIFNVRNGQVEEPPAGVPDSGATATLLLGALAGLAFIRRRK